MDEKEIIELIKGTETATFTMPGLGETTIPTILLKPMVEAWERELEQQEIVDAINEVDRRG